jgi:hypothetical protein
MSSSISLALTASTSSSSSSSSSGLPSASLVTRCRAPNLQTLRRDGGEWLPNGSMDTTATSLPSLLPHDIEGDAMDRQHRYNNRMAWRAKAAHELRLRQRATIAGNFCFSLCWAKR